MNEFTHIGRDGGPNMVDVSGKEQSYRIAKASGSITLTPETVRRIAENGIAKGNVLTVAEIAGISAAKKTAELIPLCHPLTLSKVSVYAELGGPGIVVTSEVKCTGQTGVEMEALTAVSTALLTVYDMCKAVDKSMSIGSITLISKSKEPVK